MRVQQVKKFRKKVPAVAESALERSELFFHAYPEESTLLCCIENPLRAVQLAWLWEQRIDDDRLSDLRSCFPSVLSQLCGLNVETIPSIAFDAYMGHLARLVQEYRWCGIPMGNFLLAKWYSYRQDIFGRVQAAYGARVTQMALQTDDTALAAVGSPLNPALRHRIRFRFQRNWSSAAETVAYAVFGDFLNQHGESAKFCPECHMVFEGGRIDKECCSRRCARTASAKRFNDKDRREEKREYVQTVWKRVITLIKSSHARGLNVRAELEKAVGRDPKDNPSRRIGAILKAAREGKDSPEWHKLLNSVVSVSEARQAAPSSTEDELWSKLCEETLTGIQFLTAKQPVKRTR